MHFAFKYRYQTNEFGLSNTLRQCFYGYRATLRKHAEEQQLLVKSAFKL
jgi:hypothetical protein